MLSITDFSAFERIIENTLNGKFNVVELGRDFSTSAAQPSVAQAANFDFAPQEREQNYG